MAERAQVESNVASELKRRISAYAQSQAAERIARAAQERELAAKEAALAQMQAQASADAEAQRRGALLRFGAGMLGRTQTGSFGESLGNGFGAYSGLPAPPAPVTTVCDRSGSQVICSSQ